MTEIVDVKEAAWKSLCKHTDIAKHLTFTLFCSNGHHGTTTSNHDLYNMFRIKKPDGSFRYVQAPDPSLKLIQKRILKWLKLHTVVGKHSFGLGGRESDAIHHAQKHKGCPMVLRMDIQDFFPSTTAEIIQAGFSWANPHMSDSSFAIALFLITHYCLICHPKTKKMCLATGAPTSPLLSHIAMSKCDSDIRSLLHYYNHGWNSELRYTRYIDDLIISGNKYPTGLQKKVTQIVEASGLKVKHKKSKLMWKDNASQKVTGVALNSSRGVSRKDRQALRTELEMYAKTSKPMDSSMVGKLLYVHQLSPKTASELYAYYLKRIEHWVLKSSMVKI